ncbi:MAG: hypothetical protein EHM93_18355 [Bacteroidales bacterium]|nr:MAG: hypothetical protein EHM93_18355 [Bacteroidales bacterium]
MQNPDDKHIMDRVRSMLEEYQPQCSPESWAKMSALLDQQTPKAVPVNWRVWFNGFISGLIISLIFISSYFIIYSSNTDGETMVNVKTIPTSENKPILSYKKSIDHYQYIVSPSIELKLKHSLKLSNNYNSTQYVYPEPDQGERNFVKQDVGIEQEERSSRFNAVNEKKRNLLDSNFRPLRPMEISTSYFNRKPTIEKININPNLPAVSSKRKEEKSRKSIFNWGKFDFSFKLQDDLYKNFVGPDKVKIGYSPELVLGDFQSEVGISQGFGLLLEGKISNRISLGFGGYMRQYDWQKKNEFKSLVEGTPPDTATMHFVIDSIHINKGNWKYYEIPFEITLHILRNQKSEINLNTSLAAIFLQSENYQFDRIIGQNTISQKQPFKPYSNYRILGNIKVGIEYRYRFSERWSIWAEPYYKWYLKGVGITSYKPRSFGINVGLIYQFNLHKKSN